MSYNQNTAGLKPVFKAYQGRLVHGRDKVGGGGYRRGDLFIGYGHGAVGGAAADFRAMGGQGIKRPADDGVKAGYKG